MAALLECLPRTRMIELMKAPVRGIVSVTVYDGDGNPAVLDGADYYVNLAPGRRGCASAPP
jgi:hypothetical protein